MITLAFDWGQKLMKTRMTTWMPTLWMDSANLGLTLPLRVPFKELFLLFGKWFGSRILRLLSWSPISLKMERYVVVKKNLLEMFKYCRKTTFTPHIIMSFSWHMIEVFALLLFFFSAKMWPLLARFWNRDLRRHACQPVAWRYPCFLHITDF